MLEFSPVYIDMSVLESYKVRSCRPYFEYLKYCCPSSLHALDLFRNIESAWHSIFLKLNKVTSHPISSKKDQKNTSRL